ncbi:hypothetical protein ACFJIX_10085 [Roseateles sp. UC29_93]|uniref:hypothetical protein n=1 Tax=Roseateles sp. UC29_93 TaxID=3350177 RepID=UPI00366CAE0A
MDDNWDADVDAEELPGGGFQAVLVFSPPNEMGPAVRVTLGGKYEHPELARLAALDHFVAMRLRASD